MNAAVTLSVVRNDVHCRGIALPLPRLVPMGPIHTDGPGIVGSVTPSDPPDELGTVFRERPDQRFIGDPDLTAWPSAAGRTLARRAELRTRLAPQQHAHHEGSSLDVSPLNDLHVWPAPPAGMAP
jgi:hypothetical protein